MIWTYRKRDRQALAIYQAQILVTFRGPADFLGQESVQHPLSLKTKKKLQLVYLTLEGHNLQSWLNVSISFLFILTSHSLELLPGSGVETLPEIDFRPCVYHGFLPACFSLHPPSHIFFMILFFQPCPLLTGTLILPINKLSYIHHSKTDYLYTFSLELKPGHANFLVILLRGICLFSQKTSEFGIELSINILALPCPQIEHGSLAILITFIRSYACHYFYHLMKPPPASISKCSQIH